jgi:hypothetical protein
MTAVYLDSSAIVKLAVLEPESSALRRYLRRRRPWVSSSLARTEVLRALLPGGENAAAAGPAVVRQKLPAEVLGQRNVGGVGERKVLAEQPCVCEQRPYLDDAQRPDGELTYCLGDLTGREDGVEIPSTQH